MNKHGHLSRCVIALVASFALGCNDLLDAATPGAEPSAPPSRAGSDTHALVALTTSPTLDTDVALAWNPVDEEYGIVFHTGYSPSKLSFMRVDRAGRILFGPAAIHDEPQREALPKAVGGARNPSITYVTSSDRWAIAYHMGEAESADQAYAFIVDDHGTVYPGVALDDGGDSEAQSITYSAARDELLTSVDHVSARPAGASWAPRVQRFHTDLSRTMAPPVDVSRGMATNPSHVELPGFRGRDELAFAAFNHIDEAEQRTDHLFAQLVDLTSGSLEWGPGTSRPEVAGKVLVEDVGWRSPSRLAWSPESQLVALTYTDIKDGSRRRNDAFFALINPETGAPHSPWIHLNQAAPGRMDPGAPQVAWDGEEFLVAWNEDPDGEGLSSARVLRVDADGGTIGAAQPLHEGIDDVAVSGAGLAMVGHDGIHAVIYTSGVDRAAEDRTLWLCIEPPCAD